MMKMMNLFLARIMLVALGMALSAGVMAESSESAPMNSNSQDFVVEKYLGKYDELEKNGYTTESGIGSNFKKIPAALALAVCRSFEKDNQFDCIFLITEIKEATH